MKTKIMAMGLGAMLSILTPFALHAGEDGMDLADTAEAIRNGDIDVGKEYSMHKKRGRYHRIHSEVLGLECEACHVSKKYAPDYLLVNRQEEEARALGKGKRPKADVVDRAVCMGCHKENGVAHTFYRTAGD